MATICLCMIVRNEGHVIERALRSVKRLVDYWVICDTGSEDETPVLILNAMSGVPGELHRQEWVNFGHNRQEAIRLASTHADYVLIMDADMIANVHAPFKHKLAADCYEIRYEGDVDYSQLMLVSSRREWSYTGATHEFIHTAGPLIRERLAELTLTHFGDGAMRWNKLERDITLLTGSLASCPEDPRTNFYLAQSYCDSGDLERALEFYERRARLEGWKEERWYARYRAARMGHLLEQPWDEVENAYLSAFGERPERLEPLFEVVRHHRRQGWYSSGHALATLAGLDHPYPDDFLFIDKPIHTYLFALEYGVCAYGDGQIGEAIESFNQVLRQNPLPAWVFDSARRGRAMALADLFPIACPRGEPRNHLVVIVPFHNPGAALAQCVASLAAQDCSDFEVLFIDDASSDDSASFLPSDPRMRVLRNSSRHGLAPNLHRGISEHCDPEDVVVCVDGDDSLAAPDALSEVNRTYHLHDCWVTYSQFQFADGQYGFCQPFASTKDFATLRDYFRTSHLRTFRAGLFHRIAEQDPGYRCLKDAEGEWLSSAIDAALMCPLLEMAGFERVRYIDRVLYVYNDRHPGNIHSAARATQLENFEIVRHKPGFQRVDHYRVPAWREA
jgi:glycosyltransferase involved in cell wall biosynthesis